jgi:glucosamine--fructose-6-phosphate aminotransferase (isomerizing)
MLDYDPTSGYLHDILEQPAALRDTLTGLEGGLSLGEIPARLARGDYQHIVLTGMGSSYHGLNPLTLQLLQHGLPALMIETSELIHQVPELMNPMSLVIAVSQSGRSAETIGLLDLAERQKATVLGVSNTPGSPLDARGQACILTRAGEEFTVSCKTYQAILLALSWLGDALTGAGLEAARAESLPAADAAQIYLQHWREHTAALEQVLNGVEHVFLAGRGGSLAACGTGGLITKESAHFHAEGMSSAALRHGPLEMLNSKCFVMVFAGAGHSRTLNLRLYEELLSAGIPAGWVEAGADKGPFTLPSAPERLRPILEILPVEMMTLALARLRGRTAGNFERGSKVTTTE